MEDRVSMVGVTDLDPMKNRVGRTDECRMNGEEEGGKKKMYFSLCQNM